MYKYLIAFLGFICLVCGGCNPQDSNWHDSMQFKIAKYAEYSRSRLGPYFERAGMSYPPQHLAFLIFKQTRQFEIYARDNGQWKYIHTFPIYAASGGLGPKLHAGDYQVPEGIYHIVGLNPHSHFDLSMHLDYPNDFDREHAGDQAHLGGDIYIHGDKKSVGCIAIGNDAIQQVFPLVYFTGINHVVVIIAPYDFRIWPPAMQLLKVHPAWVATLYSMIQHELKQFPLHP